jgi:hypothetical protein
MNNFFSIRSEGVYEAKGSWVIVQETGEMKMSLLGSGTLEFGGYLLGGTKLSRGGVSIAILAVAAPTKVPNLLMSYRCLLRA